jgi:hypothetical protein
MAANSKSLEAELHALIEHHGLKNVLTTLSRMISSNGSKDGIDKAGVRWSKIPLALTDNPLTLGNILRLTTLTTGEVVQWAVVDERAPQPSSLMIWTQV